MGCFVNGEVETFIDTFKNCGFRFVWFWDGADNMGKLNEVFQRKKVQGRKRRNVIDALNNDQKPKKSWKILPSQVGNFVRKVIAENDQRNIFSTGEADREIAQYCISNRCFGVLSGDSDFIIYRVPRLLTDVKFSRGSIQLNCYDRRTIDEHFGIAPAHMPLFATLLGCDYFNKKMIRFWDSIGMNKEDEESKKVEICALFLSEQKESSLQSIIDENNQLKKLEKLILGSVDQFTLIPNIRDVILEKRGIIIQNDLLKDHIFENAIEIDIILSGQIVHGVRVENPERIRIKDADLELRHILFDLLNSCCETSRKKFKEYHLDDEIQILKTDFKFKNQYFLPVLYSLDENMRYIQILTMMNVQENLTLLNGYSSNWTMLLLVLKYILNNQYLEFIEIKCFLLCAMVISIFYKVPEELRADIDDAIGLDMVHSYNIYLKIYGTVGKLCELLKLNIKNSDEDQIFDGRLFSYIYNSTVDGDLDENYFLSSTPGAKEIYDILLNILLGENEDQNYSTELYDLSYSFFTERNFGQFRATKKKSRSYPVRMPTTNSNPTPTSRPDVKPKKKISAITPLTTTEKTNTPQKEKTDASTLPTRSKWRKKE